MDQKKPYFFLLGGYDLEMSEIRKLLEQERLQEGEDFLDKHLSWGAGLSAYEGSFHHSRINVAIELREDITLPGRYLRIDHHNELPSRPTSIEQVATLLGVGLSRWQELVAANDASYIPGMKALGASSEEIGYIRRLDRICQGISEEDEKLAETAIREKLYFNRDVAIIQALSSKFSPITDRLFGKYEKMLIFSGRELTYYGKNQSLLKTLFGHWIKSGTAYSGGGEEGFWGVSAGALTEEEILELVAKIPEIV